MKKHELTETQIEHRKYLLYELEQRVPQVFADGVHFTNSVSSGTFYFSFDCFNTVFLKEEMEHILSLKGFQRIQFATSFDDRSKIRLIFLLK